MKLTGESKLLIGILLVTAAVIGIAVYFFSQPAKPLARQDLVPSGAHTFGNATASVYLVEFSDFECPACGAFEPTVEDLMTKYQDKLLFAYRHFPLPQHLQAIPAAKAAEAASLQGKFWEMHKLLFANQANLSDSLYLDLAKQLNLDTAKFQADLKTDVVNNLIQKDQNYGNSIGINATPTFFLNGVKLDLSGPADLRQAVIDAINK